MEINIELRERVARAIARTSGGTFRDRPGEWEAQPNKSKYRWEEQAQEAIDELRKWMAEQKAKQKR